MRVSYEFLLHSHGCSGLVQPRTISVAERVKPDPVKSQFQTCRNQIVVANRVGVIRSTYHWAREEPVSFGIAGREKAVLYAAGSGQAKNAGWNLDSGLEIEHDPCWRVVACVLLPARPSVNAAVHEAVRQIR